MLFGVERSCGDCGQPTLAPGNVLVWEIYRTLGNPFCGQVDIFKLLQDYGVARPYRMLENLARIHDIARANAKRGEDSSG